MKTTTNPFAQDFYDSWSSLRDKFNKAFSSCLSEFWESNPTITSISWLQYSPSFNDGDPCVFAVHDFTASEFPDCDDIDSLSQLFSEDCLIDENGVEWLTTYQSELSKYRELGELICSKPAEAFMEEEFGDGVRVIATRFNSSFHCLEYYAG